MAKFQKGNTFSNGRPKGSANKIPLSAKQSFEAVFIKLGGADGLYDWASNNKTAFYQMYAKLLPKATDITSDGQAVSIAIINYKDTTS